MQHFKLLTINNILESVYYKYIYNPKHIKYKSLYSHTRDKVKGKLSDNDITMMASQGWYLCVNIKTYKQQKLQKKDIAKYYNISRPAISRILLITLILSGDLFDKHIAEFETTINGGSYKVIDDNKLNLWKDRNRDGINNIVKAINTYKTL